jgi:hypothetical protein
MFKHKPDVPGEGGTGSIVKGNCHIVKPTILRLRLSESRKNIQ